MRTLSLKDHDGDCGWSDGEVIVVGLDGGAVSFATVNTNSFFPTVILTPGQVRQLMDWLLEGEQNESQGLPHALEEEAEGGKQEAESA